MNLHCFSALALLFVTQTTPVETARPSTPSEVKAAFHQLLDRPKVALDVLEVSNQAADGLTTERLDFATEKKADGSIERVPLLLIRPEATEQENGRRRPAVIVLHGTGGSKDGMRAWLVELARRGIIGVAIDARYHGGRSGGAEKAAAYNEAITRAWRAKPGEPQEHPFYYDTCWDLWRTVDYLVSRRDVDPDRIGMLGTSMGGIETWLAAAVDARVAVAVPAIGVQSFRWSLEHEKWQGRARTIAATHQAAAADLGESEVNAKVCQALWSKVIPGILGPFDCPSMLRLFAGRPLLILNGELDPNCPLGGAEVAFAAARDAFRDAGVSDRLEINVAKGVGHTVTPEQRRAALDWFVRWLKP
jgi:dienelactone hydrolase